MKSHEMLFCGFSRIFRNFRNNTWGFPSINFFDCCVHFSISMCNNIWIIIWLIARWPKTVGNLNLNGGGDYRKYWGSSNSVLWTIEPFEMEVTCCIKIPDFVRRIQESKQIQKTTVLMDNLGHVRLLP
jgi:hypothetical protein